MAASPSTANCRYHARSTSFPSASHPLTISVQEELNKLRCWAASISSNSCSNTEILQEGICGLLSLYESVEGLLQLPRTQRILALHRDERCMDTVLDQSLRLLDVSSTTDDVVLQMKEHIQQTQSDLRRKRAEGEHRYELENYMQSRKKIHKVIKKCLGEFRKHHTSATKNVSEDAMAVVNVLGEVESMTLTICTFILSFLLGSRRQSLFSKFIHDKAQDIQVSQVESVHTAILALSSHRHVAATDMLSAHIQLKALKEGIQSLEDRLECVFRRLLKTRVSLLNILSN